MNAQPHENCISHSIGVIIPTYMRPERCLRAVNSVKSNFPKAQIIVVDDASPISFQDELTLLLKNYDIKLILLKKNIGGNGARKSGCQYLSSSVELVLFLDDDDYLFGKPNSIVMKGADVILLQQSFHFSVDWLLKISAPRTWRQIVSLSLFKGSFVNPSSLIIAREHINLDLFDARLRRYQDLDIFLNLPVKLKVFNLKGIIVKRDLSDRSNSLYGSKRKEAYLYFLGRAKAQTNISNWFNITLFLSRHRSEIKILNNEEHQLIDYLYIFIFSTWALFRRFIRLIGLNIKKVIG